MRTRSTVALRWIALAAFNRRLKSGPKQPIDYHFCPAPMLLSCLFAWGPPWSFYGLRRLLLSWIKPARPGAQIHLSGPGLFEPFCGGARHTFEVPKPHKPTLKAPLPPRRGFRFCRGHRMNRLMPVPELTSMADIKLNTRVSLRPAETSLAWLQSRRLAAPSLACVLCDRGRFVPSRRPRPPFLSVCPKSS